MALVVLLRGVNVGGRKTFRPKRLAEELRHLGAQNIGAAGTLVIRGRVPRRELRAEIAKRLPFDAEILICEGKDVVRLLSRDHFAGQPVGPDVVRFATLLARPPRPAPSLPLILPERGDWVLKALARDGRFVVGMYRRRMQAARYLGTLDRLLGVPATTRNWNTLAAIAKAMGG